MPDAGDLAPEIALPDETGTVHRLADQRGRWTIVYFYPKDDTPGCTVEACEFRDANETIHERGADVWGISPQGAQSKRAFREKFGLPFILLADADHAVAEAYGSWVEKQNYGKTYMGVARTTFLVDPDGRIARTWPKVKPEGHAADVLGGARRGPGAPHRRAATDRGSTVRRTRSEASLVGGDERSLGRNDRPAAHGRNNRITGRNDAAMNEHRPSWRPDRFMVIAAHPDDADFGPAGTAARWIDAGLGRLARVLHERRRGRRGSGRRSARAGRLARARAARRGRDHRLRGRDRSCTARRRARQRPGPARAARPRDPDVPARRGPRDRPDVALLRRRRRSTTPTTGRPGWPPSTRSIRRPATRWRSRAWPGAGLAAHTRPPAVPLLVRTSRPSGSTSATTLDRKIAALRAHAQPDQRAGQARRADPGLGGRGGRADRRRGRRGAPGDRHRRRRGRGSAAPRRTREATRHGSGATA